MAVGRNSVSSFGAVNRHFSTIRGWLTPDSAQTFITSVIATRAGKQRVVPLRRACGETIDRYRVGPQGGS